ncbi:MAG: LCP family protein [Actinomycetes bacterium]
MTHTDDEDWLYRRGSHAGGDPDRIAPPAQPPAAAPAARDQAPTEYGAPTPVGHYRLRSDPPERPSAPPPPPPRGPAPSGAGRRRPARRVVTWVLVGVLLYLVGIPLLTWPFMPRVDATPTGERPADTPGQVYVLAGSDSREGLSAAEQERLGTGSDAGQRTDTIMLLYVPPGGRATLLSVPRDSYLTIPGHGKNKVNAAYAIGGPPLLVATLEQNTGVRVDGFAEIGFGGFAGVVDAVGGIEMCPATAIKDRDSNLDIPAGCQQMDGATALGYVRMRKADPEGDLGRAKRQREMVSALAKKTLSPSTIAIPWRWWGVNWSLSRGITLGQDDGLGDLFGLGVAGVRIGTGSGDMLVVPISNADATTSAGSSVLWNTKKSKAMFEAMARGEGDLKPFA